MRYAVIIPAYNASESLGELLTRTVQFLPSDSIIVIDDGSVDETAKIAATHHVQLLQHQQNKGKGAALQTGFHNCLKDNYDAVITMDADLQHRPEDIPRFIERFEKLNPDIIIGSRLHNLKGMPFLRILSNTITTLLVQTRTGASISDSQSGFRLISRRVLEKIQVGSSGFEAETEFLIKAAQFKFSFDAIPIATIYSGEKSHMTYFQTTINFIKTLFKRY